MNQFTAVYSGTGELINSIKYYDGFMGQRVGAISCLAFHPYWVCVPTPGWGWGSGDLGASSSERVGCSQAPKLPSLLRQHQVPCHSGKSRNT